MVSLDSLWHSLLHGRSQLAWMLALPLLIAIKDTRPGSAQAAYDHAHQLFVRGDLIATQQEAEQGYRRFVNSDPEHAARFQLLVARALIWRGMNEDALRALAAGSSIFSNRETKIESLTLNGMANMYRHRFGEADRTLTEAQHLCEPAVAACGDVTITRGVLALERGQLAEARPILLEGLSLVRTHRDRRSESLVLLNLAVIALQSERYDEALDWANAGYRIAKDLALENLTESALGNLGWAYFELGDHDRALEMLLDAEQRAEKLGDTRNQIRWLNAAGYFYRDAGDAMHAAPLYRQSLVLSKRNNSQQDIVNALEDLTFISIEVGKLDDASSYIDQVTPMLRESGNRPDELDVMLARGEIAAARGQNGPAETIFRTVERDSASPTSLRLESENHLARLFEVEGNAVAADAMYRTTLTTFEASRSQLKNEDSQLPFLTNATRIYDDYIHFLVKQGKTEAALAVADQSRARTLAQGLGLNTATTSFKPAALHPVEIARKTGATVLFYWLGQKQSYLWAIGAKGTKLFTLPPQAEIARSVERYRKALLQPGNQLDSMNEDGLALYRTLVAPAADVLRGNGNVVVVSDGPLSLLNFETLIVPGDKPHYWIEDANVVSAPSLYMLASAKPSRSAGGKLLLVGDAVSPNPDYPELPMAAIEMRQIQKHFSPSDETVFARQTANSNAYLASAPQHYSYIHFVAHGVASRTDPLDSAIILSRTSTEEDSFKLHAREIIQHPIDARLVTISACYGGGTRSYAGEGLVGLSWAFLRAGAHNVIGALWEASDESTPALMDGLYQGLQDGKSPSAALRQSKLALLHAPGKFRQPFYWAPFQIYTGH